MENEAAPTGGRLASPEVIGGKSNRHSGEKGAPQAPFFHALFWVAAGGGTCGEPPRRFLRRGGGVGCCGGGDVASGRALRGRFGRKRRGGRLFFMPFFGVMAGERGGGRKGCCGGVVCCGAFGFPLPPRPCGRGGFGFSPCRRASAGAAGRVGRRVAESWGGRGVAGEKALRRRAGAGMVFGRAAGGAAAFVRRFFVVWGREPSLFGGGRLFLGGTGEREGVRGRGAAAGKWGGE